MNKFYQYLTKIRPLINAVGLNEEAKLPDNTLGKHFRWVDGKPDGQRMPLKHIPNVIRALNAAGMIPVIDGWSFYGEFGHSTITAIKQVGEPKVIEKGNAFEYEQKQYRNLIDEIDFLTYFNESI